MIAESTRIESVHQQQSDDVELVTNSSEMSSVVADHTLAECGDQIDDSRLQDRDRNRELLQIRSLTLPTNRRTVGRPKGSVNNTIGLKRKISSKVGKNKRVKVTKTILVPQKRPFHFTNRSFNTGRAEGSISDGISPKRPCFETTMK